MRILHVSIFIISAALCAWLSACASAPKTSAAIPAVELRKGLADKLPGALVVLEDGAYLTISDADMWRAIGDGWLPWRAEVWDCDDQAAGILHALRVRYRDSDNAPAAGRMTVTLRGQSHCVVWWVADSGKLRFFDPSTLTPLDSRLFSQPRNVTDK